MSKRIVGGTIDICDINMMPASCRNRFIPLWSSRRQDILLQNGILHCGIGENRGDYAFGRKDPNFHLVLFTRKGTGIGRNGPGAGHYIRKGDLSIFPAHQPHYYTIAGNQWDHLWFHLADTGAWSFLASTAFTTRKASYWEEIERLLICYHDEAVRDAGQSADLLWHLGESILHYLRRDLRGLGEPEVSDAKKRFDRLVLELREAPQKQWTLTDISERLCFSKVHAIRFFKAQTGNTPFEYLTMCRMQSAVNQLLSSDDKIRVIAERVGYTDQFAFSVAFSRFHHLSPGEFRKRFLKNDRG